MFRFKAFQVAFIELTVLWEERIEDIRPLSPSSSEPAGGGVGSGGVDNLEATSGSWLKELPRTVLLESTRNT